MSEFGLSGHRMTPYSELEVSQQNDKWGPVPQSHVCNPRFS